MIKQVFGLVVALIVGMSASNPGCHRRAGSTSAVTATEARSVSFLKKKLETTDRRQLDALNAHARIFFDGNGQSIAATANIIWIRDSVLWLNVKKFGLEAARALITKDSVYVLNRLEKTYSAKGLESLQREYSLPAGFDLIQSLLLATPWFFQDMPLQADVKDGAHRLSGTNGRYAVDYRLDNTLFRLHKEIFIEPRNAQTVSVSFEEYKKDTKAGWFPYLRTVEAFSPETGELRISVELNDVQINVPKSFRFEIPKHYERTK